MLTQEKVAVVFGGWTSLSRKAALPIFEQMNGLLFYPVQYEGEESSRNIFYLGAAPNQQAIPAVRYLMSKEGGDIRRWILLGTDYLYPRKTNQILSAYLAAEGVSPEDITTIYASPNQSDWREIVEAMKAFAAGKKDRRDLNRHRRFKRSFLRRTGQATDRRRQNAVHGTVRQRT